MLPIKLKKVAVDGAVFMLNLLSIVIGSQGLIKMQQMALLSANGGQFRGQISISYLVDILT